MNNNLSVVADLTHRKKVGLYRKREVNTHKQVCFCSNDYLGLSTHPQVIAAMQTAANTYGVGSTSSPLIAGYKKIHQQFEEEFASFVGMERALLFSSGYAANLGALTAIIVRGEAVYQDRENHASLVDAVTLARAKNKRFRNLVELQHKFAQADHNAGKVIVTESVFSMSGRQAELAQLIQLAARYKKWLFIDEAHSIGVFGTKGDGMLQAALAEVAGAVNLGAIKEQLILAAPLGKAFGCAGGIIAGSNAYIEHCLQYARSYIYSTGISPAIAAACLASMQAIRSEPWRREYLQLLITVFKQRARELGLAIADSNTQIQSIVVGDENLALKISAQLQDKGILLRSMRYPTVPRGQACLRVSITAAHSVEDIDYLLSQLAPLVQSVRLAQLERLDLLDTENTAASRLFEHANN